jgi:uncharacterized protein (TIGR04255 family)
MSEQNGASPVYRRTPLIDLVCQVQFPAILKISQAPTGFQERVRQHFPLFGMAQDNRGYQFLSEDRSCQLVLTPSSLALVTQRDLGWNTVLSALANSLAAFQQEFRPSFYVRTGLRPRYLFRRSVCNLTGKEWNELFRVPVMPAAPWTELQGQVQENRSEVLLALQGGRMKVRLSHGPVTAQISGQGTVAESCYFLDSDVFVEGRLDTAATPAVLDTLHQEATRIFRWWISDTLHQALEPQAA